MAKWFLLKNNNTSGPLSTDQVKTLQEKGLVHDDDLIWSRMQNTWCSLKNWNHDLGQSQQAIEINKSNTWYFALKGKSRGPYQKTQLIEHLKKVKNTKEVLLWTQGMKNWSSLYDFHDILNEVGVNAREHARAAIEGRLKFTANGEVHDVPLTTISEGGFGVLCLNEINSGQTVIGEIISSSFNHPIRFSAKALYKSEYGLIGLMFEDINTNSVQMIQTYVDQSIQLENENIKIAA